MAKNWEGSGKELYEAHCWSLEQIAVMIVFMLMHKLEKSTIELNIPMQDIADFPFVLGELVKSITFPK